MANFVETTWKIDTAKLDQIAGNLGKTLDIALGEIAFQAEGIAKARPGFPVDIGNFRDSIEAKRVQIGKWRIGDGVHYGIYWEYGFHPWGKGTIHQFPWLVCSVTDAFKQSNYAETVKSIIEGGFH